MASSQGGLRWWLVVPVCLVLIVYFYAEAVMQDKPPPDEPPALNPSWHKVETARGDIRKQQTIVGNCFICHAFWVPIPRSTENSKPRFAHANIQLNHGKNDRCYSCHHVTDRNMYVADNGGTIFYRIPEQLCARCHGLIYNDWQAGTHGKWTGKFAQAGLYDKKTYTCTECHDPHAPKFHYEKIAPAPTWPEKYIRTQGHDDGENILSGFLTDEEPKEIF